MDRAPLDFPVPADFTVTFTRGEVGHCTATVMTKSANVDFSQLDDPSTVVAVTTSASRARFDWVFVPSYDEKTRYSCVAASVCDAVACATKWMIV